MSSESLSHPSTSVMVRNALEVLHTRRGISYHAIKQYVFQTYPGVDPLRSTRFIKRYMEDAITKGEVVRIKGTGMTGSFKLATLEKKPSKKVKKPSDKEAVKKTKSASAETGVVKKPKAIAPKPKTTKPSTNVKDQKSTTKARKPVADQKVKNKKISITATKVRKGKTAK